MPYTSWRNGTLVSNNAWDAAPVGLLTYTRYGYMSANMAATEEAVRPKTVRWPPQDTDPVEDWALVRSHAMSYAGHFSINQSVQATEYKGQLLHGPLVAASVPAMVGTTQVRNYVVHERADGVYLMVWTETPSIRSEIWWTRVIKG